MKSTKRCYTSLIVDHDERITRLLDKTCQVYIKGAGVWSDVFLNLLGGLEPYHLQNDKCRLSQYKYCPVVEDEEDKTEEDSSKGEPYHPGVILFGFWFGLESRDKAPVAYCVTPEVVIERYRRYLGSVAVPDDWMKTIEAAVPVFCQDERVWVDRRASFIDWQASINLNEVLEYFLLREDSPLGRSGDTGNKCRDFDRNLLTDWWGKCRSSKIGGWNKRHNVLLNMQQVYDANQHLESAQLVGILTPLAKQYQGTSGNSSGVSNFIKEGSWILSDKERKEFDNLPLEEREKYLQEYHWPKFKVGLSKAIKNAKKKAGFTPKDWSVFDRLREKIEKEVGIPYFNSNGTVRQNQFGEMANMAFESICSWKSNFFNSLSVRYDFLKDRLPCPNEDLHNWISEWLSDFERKDESFPQLHPRSINGVKDVCACWRRTPPSQWAEATVEAQQNSEDRFGDLNLFTFLAERCSQQANLPWDELIPAYQKWRDREYRIRNLRSTSFTHITNEHPKYPNFGDSRPGYEALHYTNGTENLFSMMLELFDGTNFVKHKINLADKRFVKEILSVDVQFDGKTHKVGIPLIQEVLEDKRKRKYLRLGNKNMGQDELRELLKSKCKVARNTILFKKIANHDSLMPNGESKGLRLMPTSDTWADGAPRYSVAFSVDFDLANMPLPNKKLLSANCPNGTRFIGFDLGSKTAAAFSVWEKVDPIDTTSVFVNKDGKIYRRLKDKWFLLIEHGHVRDNQKINWNHNGSCGEVKLDRFQDVNSPLTDKDRELWDYLRTNKVIPERFSLGDKKVVAFNLDLSASIKRYYKHIANTVKKQHPELKRNQPDYKEKLAVLVVPLLDRKYLSMIYAHLRENARIGSGGFSYRRIDTLCNLLRACQAYLDWCSDKLVEGYVDELREKIKTVKRERIRVTVNKMLDLAVQYKSNIIVVEGLSLQAESAFNKSMNRRYANWCPKRVLKEVQMQASLYGRYVQVVKPHGTSHLDFATGKDVPRESRIPFGNLVSDKKWCKKWQTWLKTVENGRVVEKHKDTGAQYVVAWNKILRVYGCANIEELRTYAKNHPNELLWAPCRGGDRVMTEASEKSIDADENAACNIALRGIKYVLGLYDESEKKTTKSKKPKQPLTQRQRKRLIAVRKKR